jgi:hypothetical protein
MNLGSLKGIVFERARMANISKNLTKRIHNSSVLRDKVKFDLIKYGSPTLVAKEYAQKYAGIFKCNPETIRRALSDLVNKNDKGFYIFNEQEEKEYNKNKKEFSKETASKGLEAAMKSRGDTWDFNEVVVLKNLTSLPCLYSKRGLDSEYVRNILKSFYGVDKSSRSIQNKVRRLGLNLKSGFKELNSYYEKLENKSKEEVENFYKDVA